MCRAASRMLPQCGVTPVRREDVRRKDFHRRLGVFRTPDGVTGVECRTDVILARLFDQFPEFPAQHVARMIFQRDPDTGVHRRAAGRTKDLERRFHVILDALAVVAVIRGAKEASHHSCADGLRNLERLDQMLHRIPVGLVVGLRSRTDAPGAGIHQDSLFTRGVANLGQISRIERFEVVERGKLDRRESESGAELEVLHRLPAPGANRIGVVSELQPRILRAQLRGGGGKRGDGKKLTALHHHCLS